MPLFWVERTLRILVYSKSETLSVRLAGSLMDEAQRDGGTIDDMHSWRASKNVSEEQWDGLLFHEVPGLGDLDLARARELP